LDKIQYKRKEIFNDIKNHVKQINYKTEKQIESEKPNYLQIIDESYKIIKLLIKKNVVLIDDFLSQPGFKTKIPKIRNSIIKTKLFSIRGTFANLEKKN
jgi:hypothetical protein